MIELIIIVLVVLLFVKAAKGKRSPETWGLIGLVYYLVGRVLFVFLLFGGYALFTDEKIDFQLYRGLELVAVYGGIIFSLVFTYVLGELSGLAIKRAFNTD
jgi:hypothetical protein